MRRFLLLFLTVHLLSGNMLASELVKLPFLVRHFQVHQQQNFGNTWLNFLNLHYTNAKHRQSDPAHRQLPLQQLGINTTTSNTIFPEPGHLPLLAPTAAQYNVLRPLKNNLLPSDFRVPLLRPPRYFFGFS